MKNLKLQRENETFFERKRFQKDTTKKDMIAASNRFKAILFNIFPSSIYVVY